LPFEEPAREHPLVPAVRAVVVDITKDPGNAVDRNASVAQIETVGRTPGTPGQSSSVMRSIGPSTACVSGEGEDG
jgi:hypothetical protein